MAGKKGLVTSLAGINDKSVYQYDNTELQVVELKDTSRSNYFAAVLPDKDFISYSFEMSKDLVIEGMDDSVEIKMYQDAGLNPLLEYKIVYGYVNSKIDPSMVNVQAFAVSTNTLKGQLEPYIKQYGYVDVAVPTDTLPIALYNSNTLEPQNDIFIYFERDTLNLSIFADGKFIYSKELDLGLKKFVDTFIRTTGETIKYDELIHILVTKGIDESLYEGEDRRFLIDFTELFSNMYVQVNGVIQYAERMYGIDSFQRIFIGSERGTIPGIISLSYKVFGIESFDYIFYTEFYLKNDDYIDQRYILSLLELDNKLKDLPTNPFNSTIYKRPSSFFSRPGGRLISIFLTGMFLSFAYPAYIYLDGVAKNYMLTAKLKELKFSKQEFVDFQNRENQLSSKRNLLAEKLKKEQDIYNQNKEILTTVYDKKINQKIRVSFINDLFLEINKLSIKINHFELSKKEVHIYLESKRQGQITSLLKRLVDLNYKVDMRSISYDGGLKNYTAYLKVEAK